MCFFFHSVSFERMFTFSRTRFQIKMIQINAFDYLKLPLITPCTQDITYLLSKNKKKNNNEIWIVWLLLKPNQVHTRYTYIKLKPCTHWRMAAHFFRSKKINTKNKWKRYGRDFYDYFANRNIIEANSFWMNWCKVHFIWIDSIENYSVLTSNKHWAKMLFLNWCAIHKNTTCQSNELCAIAI